MSIGLFDSGIGGLTICRAVSARLPAADIVYLADQAHVPYGTRSGDEIVRLTQASCERLFREGCDLVVLACNTASAIALRRLQQRWLPEARQRFGRPLNVLGIIVPTVERVTGIPWQARTLPSVPIMRRHALGVFATRATTRSGVFEVEISKRRPLFSVVTEACPDLAAMIEHGAETRDVSRVIQKHIDALQRRLGCPPNQVILGCTHYEVVADVFRGLLPAGADLIRQPEAIADSLQSYVVRHGEYRVGVSGNRRFLTTKACAERQSCIERYWGDSIDFERV